MSSQRNPRRGNSRRPGRLRLFVGLFAALALVVGGAALATSGGGVKADYQSSVKVGGHADAGTLELGVVGSYNFTKLVPGVPQTQTVVLTNAGNVAGKTITVGTPVTVSSWHVAPGQNPDFSQVVVTVPNSDLPVKTPVTNLPQHITLVGGIAAASDASHPGVKNLTVIVEVLDLTPEVNNPLMGAYANGTVTATASTD